MGPIQSLDELIGLVLRRKWLIIAVTVIGVVLSAVYAKSRPRVYEAVSVIQIEAAQVQEAADAPERSAASASAFQAIEQRLMTRENLTAMLDRHGIFADLPLSVDRKVTALRMSIRFEQVASAASPGFGQPAQLSAILIFVQLDDAEIAARVANDLAQSVLDASNADAIARARATRDFFAAEERRLTAQAVALDDEVAAYRNAHADMLPTLEGARRDELVGLETDLREGAQALIGLRADAAALQAQDRLRETDRRALTDLQAQIARTEARIAALEDRRATLTLAIREIPEVERQLAAFDRQVQRVQDEYRVVSQRLAAADTDLRLAENRQEERLALLERAIVPENPVSGSARRVAAAGSVASLLAGLLLAFLMDLRRPVIRSAAQMLRETGLSPVIEVPLMPVERPARAGSGLGFAALLAGLFVVTLYLATR